MPRTGSPRPPQSVQRVRLFADEHHERDVESAWLTSALTPLIIRGSRLRNLARAGRGSVGSARGSLHGKRGWACSGPSARRGSRAESPRNLETIWRRRGGGIRTRVDGFPNRRWRTTIRRQVLRGLVVLLGSGVDESCRGHAAVSHRLGDILETNGLPNRMVQIG